MHRPRIKYEHLPVRHGDDSVQIGGSLPGIAATIPDPDGTVWTLLTLLDGTRTVDQVVADLVHRHPEEPPDTVRTAIDTLVSAGYLEDADEPPPEVLSDAQRERFARSRALWRWMDTAPRTTGWHAQLALRQARVTVGARSALFLPYPKLGLIVVDEAHEASFKQEEGVAYHARDVAVMRAHFEDIPIVLASATPSLESLVNVDRGRYAGPVGWVDEVRIGGRLRQSAACLVLNEHDLGYQMRELLAAAVDPSPAAALAGRAASARDQDRAPLQAQELRRGPGARGPRR